MKRAPRVGPAFQLYFLYFTLYKTDRTLRRAFSPLSPNSAQNQFSPNDIQNYHEQSLSELTKWTQREKYLIFYQILSTNSSREIGLENLYVDIGT